MKEEAYNEVNVSRGTVRLDEIARQKFRSLTTVCFDVSTDQVESM